MQQKYLIKYQATCSCSLFYLCLCGYIIVVSALEIATSRIGELQKYFHSFTVKHLYSCSKFLLIKFLSIFYIDYIYFYLLLYFSNLHRYSVFLSFHQVKESKHIFKFVKFIHFYCFLIKERSSSNYETLM